MSVPNKGRAIDPLLLSADLQLRRVVNRTRERLAPRACSIAAAERLAGVARDVPSTDSPIFVLGSGWRTGSTLLQRMLNSTPGTLIWGEPYSEGALVQRLAEGLAFLDPAHGRFNGLELPDDGQLPTPDVWTANLTPPLGHLVEAHRAMLDRLYKFPAGEHGCDRWGVKEVVWGRDVIHLLALLYPESRFLLLVRDPLIQWRSYRPRTRHPWFYRWPETPIGTPVSFGRLWAHLVRDFVMAADELPQATIVRYEDLADQQELDRLTGFLGLDAPLRADAPRVGSSRDHRLFSDAIPAWERAVIRRITSTYAAKVGYG